MAKSIGRNVNVTDTAVVASGVALNTSTSTTISVANAERIVLHVSNDSNANGFWLKMQAASVDDDKKGIFITGKVQSNASWTMPPDNIYTGEISAIADADGPCAFVTEY